MVGSLGDTCWSGFCTGNCVATCTGGGMTARKAVWDKSMFVDTFVNSIHYHWYCIDIRGCVVGWIGVPSKSGSAMVNSECGVFLRRFV